MSLVEITFYIIALFRDPAVTPFISLRVISCRPTSLLHRRRSSSVPALGHSSDRLSRASTCIRILRAVTGSSFPNFRSSFSVHTYAAGTSYSVCWSPGALVVGGSHHARNPSRKSQGQ
jgi:hypothetical protein